MHSNKWKMMRGKRDQREQYEHLSPSLAYRLNELFDKLKGSNEFDPWGSWSMNESVINELRVNLAVLEHEVEDIRKNNFSEYTLRQLYFLRLNIIDSFINHDCFETLNKMKKFMRRGELSDDLICEWLLKFQKSQIPKQYKAVDKNKPGSQ